MEGKRKAADTTTADESGGGNDATAEADVANGGNGHDTSAKRVRTEPVAESGVKD